jgi:putative SOS response-associated peptidase YedK
VKPSFRRAFRSRRCLVVADGLYEWKRNGHKQPYFVRLRNPRPFGLAGLWERWDKGGEPVESCTILTTEPNDLLRPIHGRMPVLVPAEKYDEWLRPDCPDPESLLQLLKPCPSHVLTAYPVRTLVNDPSHDGPGCVEPLESDRERRN